MSRFLVTGGAGFIGSHIAGALVEKGHSVRVLDNLSSGKTENIGSFRRRIEFFRADIRSPKDCNKASRGVDFILHHAALKSVPGSLLNPGEYNEVNIQGTLNLLEAALINKVKLFVLASSASVYGETSSFPQKESLLPDPISPYALTKLCGERYCRIFSLQYGLPTVSLRYFNVFGPRQSMDDEYALVIPKFISCILNDERPPIYGTGKQSRDFIYIQNVIDANIAAVGKRRLRGEAFNIASGRDYSILELARILSRLSGKSIKPIFLKKRKGDVYKTLADLSSSRKSLGFRPRIDFIKGLKLTMEYFKENA